MTTKQTIELLEKHGCQPKTMDEEEIATAKSSITLIQEKEKANEILEKSI